jgi:thioester reductase-like protein
MGLKGVSIRLPQVGPNVLTGEYRLDQVDAKFWNYCLRTGNFPSLGEMTWKVLPVDYVAICMVKICMDSRILDSVTSIAVLHMPPSKACLTYEQIFEIVKKHGLKIKIQGLEAWKKTLGNTAAIFNLDEDSKFESKVFPSKLGLPAIPEMNEEYMRKMFEFLLKQ